MVVTAIVGVAFDSLDAQPVLISADEIPVPYANTLEDAYLPSVDRMVSELRSLVNE